MKEGRKKRIWNGIHKWNFEAYEDRLVGRPAGYVDRLRGRESRTSRKTGGVVRPLN